jgi:hypothetical protein
MVKVSLEVREGTDSFEVTAHADSISQAVGATKRLFPGGEVRVVFPIDGDEFFGGDGTAGGATEHGDRPVLLPARAR